MQQKSKYELKMKTIREIRDLDLIESIERFKERFMEIVMKMVNSNINLKSCYGHLMLYKGTPCTLLNKIDVWYMWEGNSIQHDV